MRIQIHVKIWVVIVQFSSYFMHFCLKQNYRRLVTNSGIIITRFSLQHVFCLYCCNFRNCGENMSTVDGRALHAIPVINLPFPSLFVYVKLWKQNKHTHVDMCLHQFFYTGKAKPHISHTVFPYGYVEFYDHKKEVTNFY